MVVAQKRDPAKWARAKAKAKAKMGGKHSARAMQLAVKIPLVMNLLLPVDQLILCLKIGRIGAYFYGVLLYPV